LRERGPNPARVANPLNRLEHAPLRPGDRYHKDRSRPGRARQPVRRPIPGGVPATAQADRPRSRRDRRPSPRSAGGPLFHGYYSCYCYLPLYVFCGRHLLAALLRPSNIAWPPERGWGPVPQPGGQAAGAVAEVARIVDRIRTAWPRVGILLRADSGFARDELMAWCEGNRVDYVFGLARNARLIAELEADLAAAAAAHAETGQPARRFREFVYAALDSWSGDRRVIGKAEHLAKGANPRFIVTSLPASAIDCRSACNVDPLSRGIWSAPDQGRDRFRLPVSHRVRARPSAPRALDRPTARPRRGMKPIPGPADPLLVSGGAQPCPQLLASALATCPARPSSGTSSGYTSIRRRTVSSCRSTRRARVRRLIAPSRACR
jgi:Transposase DDE domain group 1